MEAGRVHGASFAKNKCKITQHKKPDVAHAHALNNNTSNNNNLKEKEGDRGRVIRIEGTLY